MKYYYTNITDPYKIEVTELINELVILLYDNEAQFITESQKNSLNLPENYFELLRKEISKFQERVPF